MEPITFAVYLDPSADLPPEVLSLLMDRLVNRQPVLDMLADTMAAYEKENFADQGQTFGEPWKPSAAETIREKERQGYSTRTLVRTGNLENEVGQMWSFTDGSASVGIDLEQVPYAWTQNFGGFRTPARLLISVSQDEIEEMQQEIQGFYDDIPGMPPGAVRVVLL